MKKNTDPSPPNELPNVLLATAPTARLADMAEETAQQGRFAHVVREHRQADQLRAHGLAPTRKILLVGPPGTGKTLTAQALAGELGLALYTVQIDGLIGQYLGETSGRLRRVFDHAVKHRGVYLFDEVDAIGLRRSGGEQDREISRVVNTFLQLMDQSTELVSILVCATNLVGALDPALYRRFDEVVEYARPSRDLAARLMRNRLAALRLDTEGVDWDHAAAAAHDAGASHADIVRACERAAKTAILGGALAITAADLRF